MTRRDELTRRIRALEAERLRPVPPPPGGTAVNTALRDLTAAAERPRRRAPRVDQTPCTDDTHAHDDIDGGCL